MANPAPELVWPALNRLMSFRRRVFVSGHFEPVIKATNADAPDTQLVQRRPVVLLL
jgi:hypothetical protein